MSKPISGKKIAILATDGYEQVELIDPKKNLEKAGATVRRHLHQNRADQRLGQDRLGQVRQG
jgi:putative intracellular protease/amidase